jgi:NTP pyrophosphatase (non-canonical NTP hydrolase)
MSEFAKIVAIARENVRNNPDLIQADPHAAIMRYLEGLQDEVAEVRSEVREQNEVYLTDELSDIAWDYAVLLALCEKHGYTPSAEQVLEHGSRKYTERAEAFSKGDGLLWKDIKEKQKAVLATLHAEKYSH